MITALPGVNLFDLKLVLHRRLDEFAARVAILDTGSSFVIQRIERPRGWIERAHFAGRAPTA
ncbi:MAG: hypothetical protein WCJ30_27480, partial [Deltaproteobacteria bacterium]